MANNQIDVTVKHSAVIKTVEGVELYWVESLVDGGVNLSGLSSMLNYDKSNLSTLLKQIPNLDSLDANINTAGGQQTAKIYMGASVIRILNHITNSGIQDKEVKKAANTLFDQLAIAGFRLGLMMQVTPDRLTSNQKSYLPIELTHNSYVTLEINKLIRNKDKKALEGLSSDSYSRTLIKAALLCHMFSCPDDNEVLQWPKKYTCLASSETFIVKAIKSFCVMRHAKHYGNRSFVINYLKAEWEQSDDPMDHPYQAFIDYTPDMCKSIYAVLKAAEVKTLRTTKPGMLDTTKIFNVALNNILDANGEHLKINLKSLYAGMKAMLSNNEWINLVELNHSVYRQCEPELNSLLLCTELEENHMHYEPARDPDRKGSLAKVFCDQP